MPPLSKGTERPNVSPEVSPEALQRWATDHTTLLQGGRWNAVVAVATVSATVAALWAVTGWAEAKVAIISALSAWAALVLAVGSEWFYMRYHARGAILAGRLLKAGERIDKLDEYNGELQKELWLERHPQPLDIGVPKTVLGFLDLKVVRTFWGPGCYLTISGLEVTNRTSRAMSLDAKVNVAFSEPFPDDFRGADYPLPEEGLKPFPLPADSTHPWPLRFVVMRGAPDNWIMAEKMLDEAQLIVADRITKLRFVKDIHILKSESVP